MTLYDIILWYIDIYIYMIISYNLLLVYYKKKPATQDFENAAMRNVADQELDVLTSINVDPLLINGIF